VGSFRRAFELPALIDADKVEAVHQNGILMLRLPKSPEDQPRQISVQAS
jgi:HSP20 family protein